MLRSTRSGGIGPGRHYLQEDNPHLIGEELAKWIEQVMLDEDGERRSLDEGDPCSLNLPISAFGLRLRVTNARQWKIIKSEGY